MNDDKTPHWPDGIPADHVSNYEWPAAAIVFSTNRTRNSTMLIEYLRGGGVVTPPLAAYIADLLEGKHRATPKPIKLELTRSAAREVSGDYSKLIENVSDADHPSLMAALKRAGYQGDFPNDSKGERTKAADLLAAYMLGLKLTTFDEMKNPRKARQKST